MRGGNYYREADIKGWASGGWPGSRPRGPLITLPRSLSGSQISPMRTGTGFCRRTGRFPWQFDRVVRGPGRAMLEAFIEDHPASHFDIGVFFATPPPPRWPLEMLVALGTCS